MHDAAMYESEFNRPFDAEDAPGASAPGPLPWLGVGPVEVLDGTSARSLATAALCARMTTAQVWEALDAAHAAALSALERGDFRKAAVEVEKADLLTAETARRADRCQR